MSTPERSGSPGGDHPSSPGFETGLSLAATTALREAKAELRTALRLRRGVRTEQERQAADHGRFAALTALFIPALDELGMVAAYLSRPGEPDTLQLVAWLAAYQIPTLLPVSSANGPSWALYDGPDRLRIGRHQIPEPTGRPLGPAALAAAGVIICPGLAASRAGARLGSGMGWYDRALDHARPDAVTAVLVDDDEVLSTVPTEPHDRRMDLVITGSRVISAVAGCHP